MSGRRHVELGQARHEIGRLRDAIRKHRDYRGDDRCFLDDEELYAILPEGYTPRERDSAVELKNCERFIASRQNPKTEYVSPEREIERLKALLNDCKSAVRSLPQDALGRDPTQGYYYRDELLKKLIVNTETN